MLGQASAHRSASGVIAGSASDVGTAGTELKAPAPIALFVFRRLEHVRLTVEALAANELASESQLYIFCDGPRSAQDEAAVNSVRDYVKTVSGFSRVTVIEREDNIGLAQSIISGVTDVVSRHGRIIVVEDDLITSKFFLRYMNDGLGLYEHDERVASIHGYIYPISRTVADTFFLRGADCWGWATWNRAWAKFEPDAKTLLNRIGQKDLAHEFDMDGSYGFHAMLRDYAEGRNNSWAIRWHASAFLENMLTLYPGQSLVNNIGLDDSGTHCTSTDDYKVSLRASPIEVARIPVAESKPGRDAVIEFFRKQQK